MYSSQTDQIKANDISHFPRPPLEVGDSKLTDQTSQANLRKLNFTNTNTLYQLAYSQVLLQHLDNNTIL
jgi:hypothetical protein